jgi:magnesium transporter
LALLSYPRDSVGRLMTNRYIAVRPEWTVEQSIAYMRQTGSDSETMAMIYVTDDHGVLVSDLRLHTLILAEPAARIADLMDGHFASLYSLQDREEAVAAFRKYDMYALPVVDVDGVLIGIVTSDDILDVSAEEATEDFQKGVAVRPFETGYLKTPLATLYRNRISWLIILVFINLFSGAGIALFETLIGAYVALVFFLPLLIDSGGNAGSQSATLVIRSMALGELSLRDFARTFWREILVSTALGCSMAAAVFLLAWWRAGPRIGVAVSISMTAVVVMGSLTGMLLPFILRKFRLDPAVASAPLVTSLVDIFGVLIYFSIASLILRFAQ